MPSGRQLFTFHFSLFTLHFLLSPSGESVEGQTKKTASADSVGSFLCILNIKCFAEGREKKSLFRFRFILLVLQQEFQLRRKQGKKERSEHQSVKEHSAQ